MFQVELREHINGLFQIYLDVHPVTGRGPWRVGYCDPRTGGWSLLHTHGLGPEQVQEIARQLMVIFKGERHADC